MCFSIGESECGCVDSSPFRIIPKHLTSKFATVQRMKSQAVSPTCYRACPFWVCHCHRDVTADGNTTLFSVPHTQDCISRPPLQEQNQTSYEAIRGNSKQNVSKQEKKQ